MCVFPQPGCPFQALPPLQIDMKEIPFNMILFFPTAEGFGVSAQIASGFARSGSGFIVPEGLRGLLLEIPPGLSKGPPPPANFCVPQF